MQICRALLKHDYCNFYLAIIEYCEPNKCLEREGFYLSSENPEYNIANNPTAPMSGRSHSDETKTKISDTHKKIDHSGRFKTGHSHSDDTKQIISDALVGNTNKKGKTLSDETKKNIGSYGK